MRYSFLKYLLIGMCIFSVLEREGGVFNVFTDNKQERVYTNAEEDTTAERNETKDANPYEYYALNQIIYINPSCICYKQITYLRPKSNAHLAWVLAVPTPPPNYKA